MPRSPRLAVRRPRRAAGQRTLRQAGTGRGASSPRLLPGQAEPGNNCARMKLDLVYNPAAGSFRKARLDALVRAFGAVGAEVTALPTRRDGVQLSGTAELVCVHGGDGTLRDTVQAL